MAISRGVRRQPVEEARAYKFPRVTTPGGFTITDVVIANTGQGLEKAQQEARQLAAAKEAAAAAAAEVSTAVKEDIVRVERVAPAAPAVDVGQTVKEWLKANLPSAEQLMAAAASMASLSNIENRVRDLVAFFKDDLDAFKAGFTSWFDGIRQEWASLTGQAAETLAQWQQQIVELTRWKEALEVELREFVTTLRGPQGKVGNTGMAGTSTTLVDRLPQGKGADFFMPYVGRNAVMGDIAIDGTTDMRYAWRWDGQGWERGGAMTNIQVRDVRVSALDASTKSTNNIQIVQAGGGGGGGGLEKLLANDAPRGSYVEIADSSNHCYSSPTIDPHAAVVWVEIVDRNTAKSGMCCATIDVGDQPGNTVVTEFAISGALFSDPATAPDVDFDGIRLGNVRVPSGITPVGAQLGTACSVIRMAIGRNVGTSGPYLIRGSVQWLMASTEGARLPSDPIPQPAWVWV